MRRASFLRRSRETEDPPQKGTAQLLRGRAESAIISQKRSGERQTASWPVNNAAK